VYEFCNNIGISSDYILSNGRVAVNNVLEGMWKEARFSLHLCLRFFTVLLWILPGCRQMQIFSTQEEEGPITLNVNNFTIVHHSVPPDSLFRRFGSVFVIWYECPNSFGPMQKIILLSGMITVNLVCTYSLNKINIFW